MPSNKIEGAFSAYLSRENKKVFDNTFTELTQYLRGIESKTNCLGRLLEHLCDAFGYQAVFAFMVGNSEVELLYRKTLTRVATDICGKLKTHCLKRDYMGGEVVDRLTKDEAMDLSGAFNDCLLIQNRTFPAITSSVSHVAIYFFGCQKDVGLEFEGEWLASLSRLWSDSFEAKLQQFRHDSNKFKSKYDSRLFASAKKIHAWLRCSELCELCEIAIGHAEEYEDPKTKSKKKNELKQKIEGFGGMWHCCLDRCWPCDGGDGFGDRECGPLSWYLWRLCDENVEEEGNAKDCLDKALAFTLKDCKITLQDYSPKTPLNAVLDKFFLLQVHSESEKMLATIENSGPDNYKIGKVHFGRFMAERLSDAPIRPESVESVIWTISEYAYSVLNADRRLHLASHLRHAARGEPSLHMMKDFYRDHFFHTIEVCQLGHVLASVHPSEETKKDQEFFGNSNVSVKVKDPIKQWYIASLLHDIGYGVDVCDSLKDWLEFFAQDAFHSLGERIADVLEGHDTKDGNETARRDFEDFYENKVGFQEEFDEPFKDHGVMGAYHIYTLIKNIKEENNAHQVKDITAAVKAIAKHSCQRIKIDYAKEPLSALLVLCDTLQTWRRPQFPHFSQGPSWMMSLLNSKGQTSEPPQTTNAKLLTNLKFTGPRKDSPQFDKYLLLRLVFDEAVNRDSFVFNVWLDALRNFQRVDFKKLPFNILVQIHTPTYRPPGKMTKIRQMDRLRDAAADTHMAYLVNFLDRARDVKGHIPQVSEDMGACFDVECPISYHVQSDSNGPQYELLSFSLKKMDGKRRFMTNSLARFRKDLKGWKRFFDDRLLVGDYSPWHHRTW